MKTNKHVFLTLLMGRSHLIKNNLSKFIYKKTQPENSKTIIIAHFEVKSFIT